ncbi:CFL1 Probable ferric reductase transmembrane component [Candida maltosa Xu316]
MQILLCFTILLSSTAAISVTHKSDLAYAACGSVLKKFSSDGSVQPFCDLSNQPAVGSMALCLGNSFGNQNEYIQPYLQACGMDENDFIESYENATRYVDRKDSNGPVSVSADKVATAWEDLYQAGLNDNYSIWFGTALLSYWLVVMLIGSLNYWSHFLFPSFVKSLHGPMSNWIRRFFILSPTFGHSHASSSKVHFKVIQAFTPLRFESIVIIGWFILCAIFCGTNIHPSSELNAAASVGNRSGQLASFAVPLLVLIVFGLLLVHAGSKTIALKSFGAYPSFLSQGFMVAAVIATVAAGLLIGHSVQIFRHSNYELFLIVHYILVVFFIVGSWVHTNDADQAYAYYAATAVWVFDKIVRIWRVSLYGVKKAKVELISNEVLKVTVARPKWWKPFPGAFAYIYFLKSTFFWQSHPFTMVDSVTDVNTLTFYIKVKGGMTHGLYKELSNVPGKTLQINVLVEGPYSQPHSGRKFDTLVLLATGTGIPGLYYAALDLIRRHDHSTKKIKLYWTIRDIKSIAWFQDELLKLRGSIVQPIIYVTCPPNVESSQNSEKFKFSFSDDSGSGEQISEVLDFVEFRYGRPSATEIVCHEVQESNGSIAFITCGTPHLVDDARLAIVQSLAKDTTKRIELFEDFQEW